MWYPLLLLMVCTNITKNNGILLLCQPIQMIGVEVRKKCDIALLIRSVINSKGRKLDCDSTTVLLPGSASAVLAVWNSHLGFICDRRSNKQGSLLAINIARILSPFHLYSEGSLISSGAMRFWITKKCSGLKKSTFGDYFDDCLEQV